VRAEDAGWDVVVLEARGRVGGRVHTLRDPFTDGLHAEAGGESIDDNHDNIQALVLRFGLQLERRPVAKIERGVVYYGGTRTRTTDFVLASPLVFQDYQRFSAALLNSAKARPRAPGAVPERARARPAIARGFSSRGRLVPEAEFLVRTETGRSTLRI
jgi:monoamine oxidase